ncbi:hypothetical protein Misp06_03360 [Microbulbifer sp. NBRC 101763]|uniref:lysozyme inhibitor LprI family protein n=1 Tax=Microbulbifer sp. NBRC 101763 TaxID=1113820 RepID=UPI0030B0DA63
MKKYLRALLLVIPLHIPEVYGGDESEKLLLESSKCGQFTSYSAIEHCYTELYGKSDKSLNKEYSEVIQYLNGIDDKVHKNRLVNAQRTWIKFRDLDCEFYSDKQPIRLNKCLSERTIQRLKEIEIFNTNYAMGCNGCPW